MKNLKTVSKLFISLLCGIYLLSACEKEGSSSSAELGGDTNLTKNQVGNTSTGTIKLGGTASSINSQVKVVENNNGLIAVEFSFPISSSFSGTVDGIGNALYGEDFNKYKSSFIDSSGNFKGKFKFKNSSEGVAIVNASGKQAVIMKYDVNVGDKWTYTKKNGKIANYKVTKKSTTDDYDYGSLKIKTVQVERTSSEPGVTKIIYIGNHKFGLIGIEMYLEDGSVVKYTIS
ncbi:hypothetical protein SDC9_117189 [bioreactor metagenome]|jgi:hypothetical protein|uniref:Lipoprotein n=1 Tax=bioreactor metagenome TaxID=1076179 RepID=A0A645BXI8_9ZZZZ